MWRRAEIATHASPKRKYRQGKETLTDTNLAKLEVSEKMFAVKEVFKRTHA